MIITQQYILRLEIPMRNPNPMHILYPINYLMKHPLRLPLTNSLIPHYMVEQLTILHVLHNEEELFGCLDDLVELDEVRVTNVLEDVDLAGYALSVRDLGDFLLL